MTYAVSPETVQELESAYGTSFTVRDSLLSGHTSRLFRAETPLGDVVIRLRNPSLDRECLKGDHVLMDFLTDHGFPTPRVHRTLVGTSHVETHDGLAEVHDFIANDGDLDAHSSPASMLQVADMVGWLQSLTASYPLRLAKPDWLGTLPVNHEAKYLTGPLTVGIGRYRTDCAVSNDPESISATLDWLESVLRAEYALVEQRTAMVRPVVVHGDMYGNNIIFRDGRIVGLLDYDFAQTGPYWVDIAELLFGVAVWDSGQERYWGMPEWPIVRWPMFEECVAKYLGRMPAAEPSALRHALIVKTISMIFYPGFDATPGYAAKAITARRARSVVEELMRHQAELPSPVSPTGHLPRRSSNEE